MNYLRFVFASIVFLGSTVSLEAATATWDRNPEATVTDYMSLLKVDGEWVIVGKIFDRQSKTAQAGR